MSNILMLNRTFELVFTGSGDVYCSKDNGGCSFMCVPAPQEHGPAYYTCLCPAQKQLLPDGLTCEGDGPTPTLATTPSVSTTRSTPVVTEKQSTPTPAPPKVTIPDTRASVAPTSPKTTMNNNIPLGTLEPNTPKNDARVITSQPSNNTHMIVAAVVGVLLVLILLLFIIFFVLYR